LAPPRKYGDETKQLQRGNKNVHGDWGQLLVKKRVREKGEKT